MKIGISNRREFIKASAMIGGATAASTMLTGNVAHAQWGKPQPLTDDRLSLFITTEHNPWQPAPVFGRGFSFSALEMKLGESPIDSPAILGFGACFNELGWNALQNLSITDREAVMHDLFDPAAGTRFTYCRMPIAANDFSVEAYSYDDVDGDFELTHFSIDHDSKTLVPFINGALKNQPNLRLWASPWTPPTWMKKNHHYAERPGIPAMGQNDNGIRKDQIGREGEDIFIQEPRYFEAYAKYFGRFIDAYHAEGIEIGVVMPQNEFNSAQNFPSCTWTPEGLARFLHYLGPEMEKRGVQVYFGTLERGNPKLLETVMADKEAARYVKGLGVQWAGKGALPELHIEYPDLKIFQSEQECGDGKNSWGYASYCWKLMKHYLRSGASGYMYWNIALEAGQRSTWGWAQNSLVTVDKAAKTYRYTNDYYVLKHLTHFVNVGAKRLNVTGTCDDCLAFRNPDGTIIALVRNETSDPQTVQVQTQERGVSIELPADSLGTLSIKA